LQQTHAVERKHEREHTARLSRGPSLEM
jgi:hypothetical protein